MTTEEDWETLPPAFEEAEVIEVGDFNEEERDMTTRSLVPVAEDPNVITGLGMLSKMSEAEFKEKLEMLARGRERVETIQKTLMKEGEDYGRVKGIARPFLQLPGAEKLSLFYGFAVRQEAERLDGRLGATGSWETPPLAYHVKSFVHLGSFDGPIVAQGYGEANSWEEKYRWRWVNATCLKCGHELLKGKDGGKLAGKWYCPGFKGGCWANYTPAEVPPPHREENTDPHSLAETLIQMACKRSLVASIRRATGTSGLFTQDEDSPSVEAQSEAAEDDDVPVVVTAGPAVAVGRGATTVDPTAIQLKRVATVSKEKDIGVTGMVSLLHRLFGIDVAERNSAVVAAVKKLNAEEVGQLLRTMETGEVTETDEIIADVIAVAAYTGK